PRRPPVEMLGDPGCDRRGPVGDVSFVDEDQEARTPTVIRRPLGVVAEHVGAPSEERGAVSPITEERSDDLAVVARRQLPAGGELWHALCARWRRCHLRMTLGPRSRLFDLR